MSRGLLIDNVRNQLNAATSRQEDRVLKGDTAENQREQPQGRLGQELFDWEELVFLMQNPGHTFCCANNHPAIDSAPLDEGIVFFADFSGFCRFF